MRRKRTSNLGRWRNDSGQITIFVAIAMALFLIGFVGFAVDMTNLWFHRQTAQGAADAACQAGVMDLLLRAEGGVVGAVGNFPTTTFDCNGSTYSPCQYASLNGYPAAAAGQVYVSFPTSVPGLGSGSLPPPSLVGSPIIRVDIVDSVRLFFSPMITGKRTSDVHAQATCAVMVAMVPIPIIITNPVCPITFNVNDTSATLQVVGGPPQSIQVNSDNTNAAGMKGTVDFTSGGPNFSGSNFGVLGGPPPTPGGYLGGTTGVWVSPHTPISDPFAQLVPPPRPANVQPAAGTAVIFNQFGCPDPGGCRHFQGGLYTSSINPPSGATLIFDPGVYYIEGVSDGNCANMPNGACWRPNGQCRYGLNLAANNTVRPSTAAGDGSGGTLFYFSGTGAGNYGSIFIGANSGSKNGLTPFSTALATCPGGTGPDSRLNLPPTLTGNVFLAPCTGTYGSSDGLTRGMLFWDNRDNADLKGQPSMQGGGEMLLAGTMYFHNCSSQDGAGLGTRCAAATDPPTAGSGYNAFFQLQGTPGSTTYILGFIVADDMSMGGAASVHMAIDPNKLYPVLKATMVR